MKFVAIKSKGLEGFVNPDNVFMITPAKGLVGVSVLLTPTGVSLEVDGTPSEVREKLEGHDKPFC